MEKKYTLGRKRTLGYASGIITESLIYNMFFTYYLVFLTTVVKLNPALAGTVSLISVVWDAVADPIIGYLADRKGADKRRFMARAIFPMAIMIIAAFLPLGSAPDAVKLLYYAAVTMIFWLCYTFYTIPYYAVVAEITQDYDERTRIRGTSSLINTGAICLGNILPAVLPALFAGMGLSLAMGWMAMVAVLCAMAIAFGVVAVRSLRGARLLKVESESKARFIFFKTMLSILRLKPFKAFAVFIFFYLVASAMIQANIIFMIVNCLGLTQDFMVVVMGVIVVTMLAFIPLTTWLAEKRDRRTACLVMFSLMLAGLVIVKMIGMHAVWVLMLEAVTMAIGTAAFWTVFYSISYDLVEVDEFANGVRREGAITAVPQLVQKFGAAIGVWLAGILLAAYHYSAKLAVQSSFTVTGIENIGTILPAVFLAASIAGLIAYPVTKERFEKLRAALEKKRAGLEISAEEFPRL